MIIFFNQQTNLMKKTMTIYELISYAASRAGVAEEELLTSRSHDLSGFRAAIIHHLRSNGWRECSVVRTLGVGQSMANHIMTRYALDRGYRDRLQRYANTLGLSGIYVPPPATKSKAVVINPGYGQLVLTAVSKHMGVPARCILGKGRGTQDAARARMVACWVLRTVYGYNKSSIGRFIGRDHATVYAALKHVEELRRNRMYGQVIEMIIKELKKSKMLKPLITPTTVKSSGN